MRLHEKYRPTGLTDVVGQRIDGLRSLVRTPYPTCVMLEGVTGTGKTSAAFALAADLGAHDDGFGQTLWTISGADFNMDALNHYFGSSTPFRFRASSYHVLVIEELEWVHPQVQRKCKDAFERILKEYRAIVVATSNDATGLELALRDRFRDHWYVFGSGRPFAESCQYRLIQIWYAEAGAVDMPYGWQQWGWVEKEFSMRRALDEMAGALRKLESREGVGV